MTVRTTRRAAIAAMGKLLAKTGASTLAGLPVPMLLGLQGPPSAQWSVGIQSLALVLFAAGSLILVAYNPDSWDANTPGERLARRFPAWCYYLGCFFMAIYIAWSAQLWMPISV